VKRPPAFTVLLVVTLGVALAFLTLPLVAIFLDVSPGRLLDSLDDPGSLDALVLSLEVTAIALAVIVAVGTPAAWFLATRSFPGRALAVTLIELPLVVPPAVAGIGLLAALGPEGLLGDALQRGGVELVFQTAGVVVALVFVASPFYVRQALASFSALDPRVIEASRTLGASDARTFLAVALPGARPGLVAGGALAWGRALGEFGATLVFAGSLRGVTQTAPLAIYERFSDDFTGALALSAVLVAASGAILLAVKPAAGGRVLGDARA
jgi:molybdate transport system permease protein